jgi:hypothetical protein
MCSGPAAAHFHFARLLRLSPDILLSVITVWHANNGDALALAHSLTVAESTDMFIVMSVPAGGGSPQVVLGTGTQNVVILLAEVIRLSHFDFHWHLPYSRGKLRCTFFRWAIPVVLSITVWWINKSNTTSVLYIYGQSVSIKRLHVSAPLLGHHQAVSTFYMRKPYSVYNVVLISLGHCFITRSLFISSTYCNVFCLEHKIP